MSMLYGRSNLRVYSSFNFTGGSGPSLVTYAHPKRMPVGYLISIPGLLNQSIYEDIDALNKRLLDVSPVMSSPK